jgi:NAD(P)-dependent dehydrogenase (short-subunit alcohol dehydrogenase family)
MKDKSVVITGGGTGIGASITRAFAAAGSTELAIIGRRENVLRETAAAAEAAYPGAKVLTFVADVSKANTVQAAFDGIVKSYGRIDICISNACFLPRVESIMESDLDDWWMSFETNVKGSYNIASAFLHHANPGSVLIDTSTCIVSMPPVLKGHSAYAASKIAGAKLHEYIANEHPDIHVASMHPGVVATDMSEKSGFPGLDNSKSQTDQNPTQW